MKIRQNLFIPTNNTLTKGKQPTFGADEQANQSYNKSSEISAVTEVPTYNVKIPIGYTNTENIKLNDDLTAHCYKLANGQKVVIVPKDGPTLIKSYVNTGSFNEPDNLRGISHFIEHNLFNGSEDLGDKVFFEEVNKMGASTNASTSTDLTDYYISSNLLEDTDLENQIKLHAGMLQSPKFLIEKLEKEKNIVNSEINMYMSDDESLGFYQTVKNLFNIKSNSLDLIAGTTNNITALTRDDVVNYFNNNYYPANITTVITGEVKPEETIQILSKYFNSTKVPQGKRKFEKMVPIEKSIRQDIISKKSQSDETQIIMGFAGPENNNYKEKVHLSALTFLAYGLYNSRFSDLEKKYGISIALPTEKLSSNPEEKSLITLQTNCVEQKSEEIIKQIYSVLNKLSQIPPTEDELTAIKNNLKKSNAYAMENSYRLNNKIGIAMLNNDNLELIQSYNKIVDEMTAEDILNVAKKYINLNKVALTVVHPSNTKAENISNNHKVAKTISFQGINKKRPINTEKATTYKLDNNFEVLLNNSNSNNIEYIFELEERNWTPKKAAVADLLNGILHEDSTTQTVKERNQFADKYGISTSLRTNNLGIYVSGNFPTENSALALDFINSRIKNPKFTNEILEEVKVKLRDSYLKHEVSPYDKFNKTIYEGLHYAFNAKDKLNSLNDITLKDIEDFYNEIFVNGEGKVTVTGPFQKHPELQQQIFNQVAQFNTVQPKNLQIKEFYKPIEKTVVLTDVNKKNQASIIEGFKFKRSKNIKDEVCATLVNSILGGSTSSRLFNDLREQRHLAYSVQSSISGYGDCGVMKLCIGTTTENQETGEKTFDNIEKSIKGFNENIAKITTEKVSEEELNNAKKSLKTNILSTLETNAEKNAELNSSLYSYYGTDYTNKLLECIDTITTEDIYNTARNIFNGKPIYSLTATKESIDANKTFLNSLEQ